ncbi:MAG: bacillithiol biosynthesis protein BshC, partial [Planctomycetota bacterium]
MSNDAIPWEVIAPQRRLFLAHLRGEQAARDLFGHGCDLEGKVDAVRRRRAVELPHRAALAEAVVAYEESLDGVADEAVAAARRLAENDAVVVIAGQQPGVGGGPLLGYVKALGVLAVARRLERETGGPVIPVWWVASEDHDIDEAGAVLLRGGARGSDLVADVPRDRTMLSRVPAPDIDWPDTEFAAEASRIFSPSEGASLGTATAEAFARLLGPRGLVVVEPHVVRGFARDLFAFDIEQTGKLAEKVAMGNGQIRREGFENTLTSPEGALHFAVDAEGKRTRGVATEQYLDDVANWLSADVSLRVLVQDVALPVAVQVAGPSEAEYLAALGPAHHAHDIFFPAVAGRPGVTLLESGVEESLRMFDTDVTELFEKREDAFHTPVDDGDHPMAVEARRLKGELGAAITKHKRVPASVRKRAEKASRALEDLAAASDRAREEARGVGASRRAKILRELLPDGVPQERRWSLLRYVLQHGLGVVDTMAEAIGDGEPVHHV